MDGSPIQLKTPLARVSKECSLDRRISGISGISGQDIANTSPGFETNKTDLQKAQRLPKVSPVELVDGF